ncbi:MAG: hypothetical protein KC910_24885, partial [Candidatus Eremiobacteraeota bacterium]|nr:hypothetical protein [Candidatus Eremiobacteraeota bacterium]
MQVSTQVAQTVAGGLARFCQYGANPSEIKAVTGELADLARNGDDLAEASSRVKTAFLEDTFNQTPDYRVRDKVAENAQMMARLKEAGQDVDPAALEKLKSIGEKAAAQIADTSQAIANQTLAMGLMAGALDAVLVAVLSQPGGAAEKSLLPPVSSALGEKLVATLGNPDEAAARLEYFTANGGQVNEVVAFHNMSAQAQQERMASDFTTEPGFRGANLRLFADAYHLGL